MQLLEKTRSMLLVAAIAFILLSLYGFYDAFRCIVFQHRPARHGKYSSDPELTGRDAVAGGMQQGLKGILALGLAGLALWWRRGLEE